MTTEQVDQHIAKFDGVKAQKLEALRTLILEVIPDAEQVIKYNMPTFTQNGKAFAGFDGFKNHIGYFPHSGQITKQIADQLTAEGYKFSDGGVQLPIDNEIDETLIRKLIELRLSEIAKQNR